MKKIFIIIIYIVAILGWSINIYASEFVEMYQPTKEELGGKINIPNRDGTLDHYTDINTYEDLYSVLEDLSFEYRCLLNEYNSLEKNYQDDIEEKNKEIQLLKDEIEYSNLSVEDDGTYKLIIVCIVIFIILVIYRYINK